MCLSGATQAVYGFLMLSSAILTGIALFTPSWNTVKDNVQDPLNVNTSEWNGLMPWSCVKHSQGATCENWWKNLPGWMKCVVICMIISFAVSIVAVVYNCLTWYLPIRYTSPITFFAVVTSALLIVALIIYAANWKDFKNGVDTNSQLGYSFWLAVGATLLSLAAVVVGAVSVCLGEHCC